MLAATGTMLSPELGNSSYFMVAFAAILCGSVQNRGSSDLFIMLAMVWSRVLNKIFAAAELEF